MTGSMMHTIMRKASAMFSPFLLLLLLLPCELVLVCLTHTHTHTHTHTRTRAHAHSRRSGFRPPLLSERAMEAGDFRMKENEISQRKRRYAVGGYMTG